MIRSTIQTRFLKPEDIPALMELERSKWEAHQAASDAVMLERMLAYPELCIGAFCRTTGRALASLFMRPIMPAMFTAPTRWENAADVKNACRTDAQSRSLFGISLSSNSADAVRAIFRFFLPRALKAGWQDVYLGSPICGFRRARQKDPQLAVWQYVHAKRKTGAREPLDPQLCYYFKRGFTHIVSIQENYFPHVASLNYGVILRAVIPLSRPRLLWQVMALFVMNSLSTMKVSRGG